MVGFPRSLAADGAVKEDKEDPRPSVSAGICNPELEEVPSSFTDCFLDLDAIAEWFLEGNPELSGDPGMADSGTGPIEFGSCIGEIGNPEDCLKADGHDILQKCEENGFPEKGVETGREGFLGVDGLGEELGVLIEEQLGKVSLGESNRVNGGEKAKLQNEEAVSDDGGSDSSSSSSDDEDSGKEKVEVRLPIEESEIVLSDDVDKMVGWSDNEDDVSEPIMSKNELKVLPPVPPVNVALQPHHETLPVGVILSIIGAQVIVEGVEKHNPLNEGSVLWVTESRSPLGIVDEIFGPVKNPYYIVRYNSESEVPAGIEQGTLVSFVEEFASHVLNDKSLYQKGYDASGENDEELSDELEFSDDEKEAEYRRMLKMKKRGTGNEPKTANKRKEKRREKKLNGNWKNHNREDPQPKTPQSGEIVPPARDEHLLGLNREIFSRHSAPNHGNQAVAPRFQSQGLGFGPPHGNWNNNNRFPHQQQGQNVLPGNGDVIWMQQNVPFQFFHTPLQANMAFQQQMGPIPINGLNGQTNLVGSPMLAPPPWPVASMGQNVLNPAQFGMGLHGQQAAGPLNGRGQIGGQLHGPQNGQNQQLSNERSNSGQFRGGGGGGGGGRGRQRGGRGRFGGGRGRFQSPQNG
ncbi:nuclear assembly factor 1 [Striga hermonthica]|uniref:H/ACA ribonucleoprotein complex non-core subunit NAF1 n=1 Tax=Striga hermonthica TaxID=68872 RepID=A0A9N7RM12_STRHE|nr:nuclear assembly factor 1 [Striga hermonthica]